MSFLNESSYAFNNIRILVSFLIIGSASLLLKRLVEQSEELNNRLVTELAETNKLLHQQVTGPYLS